MSKNGKDRRPYLPPVTKIELSEKNIRMRWVLLAALLVIAGFAFALGIRELVNVQPGWNQVEASCQTPNYSTEFTLMYDFSEAGGNAAAVNKGLTATYSEAMENAFKIFSKDAEVEEFHNLQDLSANANQDLVIQENLYQALEKINQHGNRNIFLAPVYVEYNRVFNSESDAEALAYDPYVNPDVMEYIEQTVSFVKDENHIRLELTEGNTARLVVSQEYLAFAEEMGIEEFLDLGWMRNAFVADYVASCLESQGYTKGYLASFDGFTRCLDVQNLEQNLYDRQGSHIYAPGKITYSGKRTMVFLRDYPLTDQDRWNYRVYGDGRIVSAVIAADTGKNGSCLTNLVSYSDQLDCGEILLEMLPVFMAETFDEEALKNLQSKGIFSIWYREGTVRYNDGSMHLSLVTNEDGVLYSAEYIQ